ncbi:uncharacterized protein RBU33_027701 [Hipposideros larvatus]
MQPLLLLMAFLLSPRAEAGEIIGGREAKPHSRPYMAYLGGCGGFLVREDFVLTAAHCWQSSITVTLGAHNIEQKEETQQEILVKRAIRHPQYNDTTWAKDIMLLQLEKKAKLNAAVSLIRLPSMTDQVKPGMKCSVAGWGYLGVNTRGDGKLYEVKLKIQSNEECTSRYPHYNNVIQICVGDPKKNQNAFKGDSGGPLICNNMAQGIVSYGNSNGKPPGVYTRISKFLPWIKSTMRRFKLPRSQFSLPERPTYLMLNKHSTGMAGQEALPQEDQRPLGCISCDYNTLSDLCNSRTVTLGAHNFKQKEETQQNIRLSHCHGWVGHNIKEQEKTQQFCQVTRAIPHPNYNPKNVSSDIRLLQLERNIKLTRAVKPLHLSKDKDWTLRDKGQNTGEPGVRKPRGSTSSSDLGHLPEKMQPLLLLMVFLLSPRAEAGEIIGGYEAKPHSRPYMAHLGNCGGFLVREDFVLTAAHCWRSSINVTLGAHNLNKKEETQQNIRVKKAIRHPDYNRASGWNDIMLLQLEKKAKLNAAVSPISLPSMTDQVKPGMVCSLAGWGRLDVYTTGDGKLHEVELEIQAKEECTSRYPHYDSTIQMCVGDPKKIQTSYKGDSGSPLICNNKAQGIVSYGSTCANPPVVYTRISNFLPWIKRTMRRLKLLRPD